MRGFAGLTDAVSRGRTAVRWRVQKRLPAAWFADAIAGERLGQGRRVRPEGRLAMVAREEREPDRPAPLRSIERFRIAEIVQQIAERWRTLQRNSVVKSGAAGSFGTSRGTKYTSVASCSCLLYSSQTLE